MDSRRMSQNAERLVVPSASAMRIAISRVLSGSPRRTSRRKGRPGEKEGQLPNTVESAASSRSRFQRTTRLVVDASKVIDRQCAIGVVDDSSNGLDCLFRRSASFDDVLDDAGDLDIRPGVGSRT